MMAVEKMAVGFWGHEQTICTVMMNAIKSGAGMSLAEQPETIG